MGLLGGLLGGGRGGMSPLTLALLGVLAYRTFKGKGRLADMLGRSGNTAAPGESGGLLGGLGGLLGGSAAGGTLSSGLNDLVKQFQQSGQGEKAESWVSAGPNKPMTPQELETALGVERIQWLVEQSGMTKEELLAGLSRELPTVVDKLTPDGRVPTEQEAARLV
jgi:uncharacterized protein YidB (DUF937 family)